ncbi:MAG: general secretion pathway protein GspC [Polyangiaceae bacterium]|nr:general secretion pathway protein GspC [Polyangiaceae bacterium]
MRTDDVIRRGFVVIVCFLIGAAAYFQASGLMSIAAMKIAQGVDPGAPPAYPGKTKSSAPALRDTSAAAILARNPFDSTTGPLLGEREKAPEPGEQEDGNAACEGVRVVLISSSDDPSWSFAAIAEGTQRPILRRIGDVVAGYSVDAIGSDRIRLASGVRSCLATLGARLALSGKTPISRGELENNSIRSHSSSGALPPDIAARIRVVGDREIEVDRSVIADVMEKQGDMLGRVRAVPQTDGSGKVTGLRLSGIRPGSLLGSLGIENGDQLKSVNGFELADPKTALEAYSRLMKADHLTVSVVRRGQPMNIDVRIK